MPSTCQSPTFLTQLLHPMCGFKPIPSSKALDARKWPRPKARERMLSVYFMASFKLNDSAGSPMSTNQDEVVLKLHQLAGARPIYRRRSIVQPQSVVLYLVAVPASECNCAPWNPCCDDVAFVRVRGRRPNHGFCLAGCMIGTLLLPPSGHNLIGGVSSNSWTCRWIMKTWTSEIDRP